VGPIRVLVIEDDPAVARIIELELRFAGWEVQVVGTGRAGLAQAIQDEPDAVVLDLSLPDLDGMAICRALRETSSVPVLILTARGNVRDRVEGLNAGADDYLVKPFAAEELVARLKAITRRRSLGDAAKAPVLRCGDLVVELLRHQVRRGDRLIELSKREYDLLVYLMENQGTVLTRNMILEHVWRWSYSGGTNIVDVYIGYLRSKLEDGGKSQLIHTVRGVGYVLRPPASDSA
jgi:DNA-binding response OmpR family regulator